MFQKILIANRGEIALRVIRACHEMGIQAVVAHSEADRESLPVQMADESVCIGPGQSSKSYLNIPNIISAALLTGCEAIHPGYGFLSENAGFAEIVEECGLVFIGPPSYAVTKMGDKVQARQVAIDTGLPVLPGTPVLRTVREAERYFDEIGFPMILKAVAGGGGRGIRPAQQRSEFTHLFTTAQREVREAFNDDGIYLERYLPRARHIEIQLLCDAHGNGIHLGERNCSLQRRRQKVLEEAPSTVLTPALRAEIGALAVKTALSIGYRGAGTMEFLLDDQGRYYFMEMNTRLQVEHPITELVTGIDLVRQQILVAAGEPLAIKQSDVTIQGHAVELRICAEDADHDFRPVTGDIEEYLPPGGPGVRVDSHLYRGYSVPPHYDSLLSKLCVWAPTREAAIERARRALSEYIIGGITTTKPFFDRLLT
ncbi:MAG: acetyl-CoA carboxylase biotin carboxylase subunit, partial [Ktedonobacterales bacterium]|nr:acetyl-CoA carboxylase biotin carboxylase subunit [Ktedonobacterales bacterium]